MFVGESLVLFVYCYSARKARAREFREADFAASSHLIRSPTRTTPFYVFLLPASCDVLGTGIGGVGMLYISASVWQMMRGSLLIFTSILSVVFLRKKLQAYNWVAVLFSACGLALVGVSAILDEAEDKVSSNSGGIMVVIGMLLTMVSQFFAASQMVVEEKFVKGYKCPPEQVVGSEGVWGISLMIVILSVMYFIPGGDVKSYENAVDSIHMLVNSGALMAFCLLYLFSISAFNFLGVTIAGKLSAVTRTINDALRTSIVWSVQLFVYYALGSENYGTPWKAHSWMQLIGFAFLILGSLVNHAIVKLPCLTYSANPAAAPTAGSSIATSHHGVSLVPQPQEGELEPGNVATESTSASTDDEHGTVAAKLGFEHPAAIDPKTVASRRLTAY